MEVQAVQNQSPATQASQAFNQLGKDEFLLLLIAQLRNQNPLEPMEQKEFIAQLAQLNSVEQMKQLNTNITEFLKSSELSQASSLLGKNVKALAEGLEEPVSGMVSKIGVVDGETVLTVGAVEVKLSDVLEVW